VAKNGLTRSHEGHEEGSNQLPYKSLLSGLAVLA
jgi:hypothetical protein